MDHPRYQQAHANARLLMDEDFYYSPIEESGPFGSDDAADTFAGFSRWRPDHPGADPVLYLNEQLEDWGYPPLEETSSWNEQTIPEAGLGVTMLIGTDAAIVALAFGQLYWEGTVSGELLKQAKRSIDRQLHPRLLELWEPSYQPMRREQLLKMLGVLNRV